MYTVDFSDQSSRGDGSLVSLHFTIKTSPLVAVVSPGVYS